MRRYLALTVLTTALACGPHRPSGGGGLASAPSEHTVDSLLAAAASDFRQQRAPQPVRFRAVRSGYLVTASGGRQYRLCGEFLPAGQGADARWVGFATVQTSAYEHWLGSQAQPFCQDAAITWQTGDLSATLQQRFDALK